MDAGHRAQAWLPARLHSWNVVFVPRDFMTVHVCLLVKFTCCVCV